ncbi:hypothetical protein [Aeromonas jandaei]|uniref:hypothetical protein n=1 Tax=Aeromonas jandaei TaxID=650 RepID=UPI001ADD9DEE|nr:hypothetical protein [Aeromonas jandaei]QTL93847.1 hypothetical protein AjGTCBM29_01703 [Aeromonas jandaei]
MSDTTEHQQNEETDGTNHYYSEQYLELQKEPVLYEWEIDHRQRLAWEIPIAIGGFLWSIGVYLLLTNGEGFFPRNIFLFIFGAVAILQGRYLFTPNQLYHYRMTAKGIYYTQQDKIPEMAYTIARGIGALLIMGSIIAVGLVGPLALAGAGAGAFLAFKITNMKPQINHYGCKFSKKADITIYRGVYGIDIFGRPFDSEGHATIFTNAQEYENVLNDIIGFLPEHKLIEVSTRKEFGY